MSGEPSGHGFSAALYGAITEALHRILCPSLLIYSLPQKAQPKFVEHGADASQKEPSYVGCLTY